MELEAYTTGLLYLTTLIGEKGGIPVRLHPESSGPKINRTLGKPTSTITFGQVERLAHKLLYYKGRDLIPLFVLAVKCVEDEDRKVYVNWN